MQVQWHDEQQCTEMPSGMKDENELLSSSQCEIKESWDTRTAVANFENLPDVLSTVCLN